MRNKVIRPGWAMIFVMVVATAEIARADFVDPGDFDFKKLLAPPPADHSDAWKAEIDEMLKLQDGRTKEDLARIESESKMTPFIFSKTLGSWFNPDDLPETAKFLTKVMKDGSEVCVAGKNTFQRLRPFKTDARLHPVSDKEKTFSYPSSHSTRATVLALVLSEMLPDESKALMAEATQIGQDRVIAGQHYPSDVAAGRVLAGAIFDKMKEDPKFQKELAEAKSECAGKESLGQASK